MINTVIIAFKKPLIFKKVSLLTLGRFIKNITVNSIVNAIKMTLNFLFWKKYIS